ncbi:NADPH2:quinone reductase [Ruaniaceae bacterium KH17]|nr:NADPH2:quinone reductase [Ruaniaceae bacterium KH17]
MHTCPKLNTRAHNGLMRAIQAMSPGSADVLAWNEVDRPACGPDDVIVQLHAAGVNFIDTYRRSGVYPMDYPHIPGAEGSGTVVEAGANADIAVGAKVAWAFSHSSYAEFVAVPAKECIPVPDGVDLDIAAALPLQGLTAHYLVRSTYEVKAGDTILITAGAGGVGGLVIQLAKLHGAQVITTVGSPEKAEIAVGHGADHVLDLSTMSDLTTEIPAAVRAIVPEGLAASYDGIGKDTFDGTLACVKPRGIQVLFGGASGQVAPFDLQRLNAAGSIFITRPSLGAYIATREELRWRAEELFSAIAAGDLNVPIGLALPLSEAQRAHEALEGRETTGKVILRAH